LSERLGSLQINEKASTDNEQTDIEMSIASATTPAVNESAGIPRSIVLDPG